MDPFAWQSHKALLSTSPQTLSLRFDRPQVPEKAKSPTSALKSCPWKGCLGTTLAGKASVSPGHNSWAPSLLPLPPIPNRLFEVALPGARRSSSFSCWGEVLRV